MARAGSARVHLRQRVFYSDFGIVEGSGKAVYRVERQ